MSATGTAAAAAGGFTSVCTMPNTAPVVDSVEWIEWLRQPERGAVVKPDCAAGALVADGELSRPAMGVRLRLRESVGEKESRRHFVELNRPYAFRRATGQMVSA